VAADGGPSARVGRPATRGEIDTVIRLMASNALEYEVEIPGTHYSGLTNQHLFEILRDQGRDFADNNRTLRKFVAAELRRALDGATRLPTSEELDVLASGFILVWILKRMDAKVRDVRIKALTEQYARAKYKAGYRTPIGIRTGALREAVASATVNITS